MHADEIQAVVTAALDAVRQGQRASADAIRRAEQAKLTTRARIIATEELISATRRLLRRDDPSPYP
jgi:hypothetical protein